METIREHTATAYRNVTSDGKEVKQNRTFRVWLPSPTQPTKQDAVVKYTAQMIENGRIDLLIEILAIGTTQAGQHEIKLFEDVASAGNGTITDRRLQAYIFEHSAEEPFKSLMPAGRRAEAKDAARTAIRGGAFRSDRDCTEAEAKVYAECLKAAWEQIKNLPLSLDEPSPSLRPS